MYRINLILHTGINSSTVISGFVDYDSNLLTIKEVNNNGRKEIRLTGEIEISGLDYQKYFNGINTGDYFDGYRINFQLYKHDKIAVSGYLQMNENNIDEKKARFKIRGFSSNIYDKIYKGWEEEINIKDVTTVDSVSVYDFRTIDTELTYGTNHFDCSLNISRDLVADIADWLELQKSFKLDWTLSGASFAYSDGDCDNDRIELNWTLIWSRYECLGWYNGTEAVPPAGIGWIYFTDQGGRPKYYKLMNVIDETYGDILTGKVCLFRDLKYYESVNYEIGNEPLKNYQDRGRLLTDVIEYLVRKIDSSIIFDVNSFSSFENYNGLDYSTYGKKSYKNLILMGLSDFIPTEAEKPKTNVQKVLNITLKTILDWFEKWGFYWYVEEVSSQLYFRLKMVKDKSLGSGNVNLKNIKGQNWEYLSRQIEWKEVEWLTMNNETTSSGFDFNISWLGLEGYKSKPESSISDGKLYTDIDYIIDAKESIFNGESLDEFVLIATTFHDDSYFCRKTEGVFTKINTNNSELSFSYLFLNILANLARPIESAYQIPYDKNRLDKRRQIKLTVPADIDYIFFNYILYFNKEAEIVEWSHKLSNNFAELKIKYL